MNAKIVKLRKIRIPNIAPDMISPIMDGVPLPDQARLSRNRTRRRYPFPDMKVGQSFTCPAEKVMSVRVSMYRYRKTQPEPKHEFVMCEENGVLRVWRIK